MFVAPAPVVEYISHAPAVSAAPAPVDKYIAPAPAVYAAPAPVVEHNTPAPAVYAAPAPVVELSPAPAVIQAPIPAAEYISPGPSVFYAPSQVVESVAQCHAPVFPLSPDASDMSSPEDMYTSSWVSLPVPIKTCTTDVSVEAEGQACETPTVMHGRGLPAVSRDRVVSSQWLRKEAARQGYAWRQRRRAQQLCSLRAACLPPGGVDGGEALRLAPPGAGVLVETLCKLATRGKSASTSGTGSGKGAGARVAVRSVLEDHETAILELERQVCVVEGLENDVDLFGKFGGSANNPGHSSSQCSFASLWRSSAPQEHFQGFFWTLPRRKQCEGHRSGQCGAVCAPQLIHAEHSTKACAECVDATDDVWVRFDSPQGPYWKKLLSNHWQRYPPWD